MLIGLFRTNIWLNFDENEEVRYVGWFVEPKRLWDIRKEEVLMSLYEIFNDAKRDHKTFIRTSAPYEKDLFAF